MAAWRDIKAKALGSVHATFSVPAVYWTHAAGTPLRVNLRDHTKPRLIENMTTFSNSPGFYEQNPRLIFDAAVVSKVMQGAYVFMSATEVYRTGSSLPARNGYIAVEATEASAADLATMLAVLGAGPHGAAWDGILP